MATNIYIQGATVKLSAHFSVNKISQDPTTITLRVKSPLDKTTVYTYALSQLTKEGTGIYYRNVKMDIPGLWHYRFEGTGAVEAVSEKNITIRKSEVI